MANGNDQQPRFSPQVHDVLVGAGWSPGRQVPDDQIRSWAQQFEGLTMFESAERVLREFGGLSVDRMVRGLEVMAAPFEIDPTLAYGEEDLFRRLAVEYGVELFPIGEGAQNFYFLAVDRDGRVYFAMGDVMLLGNSIDEALDALVVGRRAQPVPQAER